MAHDRKDVVNYIDDIPFKISNQCFEMKSVHLPPMQVFDPSEFLDEDYNFELEKKVITDATDFLIRREQARKEREEFMQSLALKEEETQNGNISGSGGVASTSTDQNPPILTPHIPWNTADILQPQPLLAKPENNGTKIKTNVAFNLKDFENDTSSPFDYMELRSINDREALNTVFQGITITDPTTTSADSNAASSTLSQQANYPPLPPSSYSSPSYPSYYPATTTQTPIYTNPYASYPNNNTSLNPAYSPHAQKQQIPPTTSYYLPQPQQSSPASYYHHPSSNVSQQQQQQQQQQYSPYISNHIPTTNHQPNFTQHQQQLPPISSTAQQVPLRASRSINDLRDLSQQDTSNTTNRNYLLRKTPSSLNLSHHST